MLGRAAPEIPDQKREQICRWTVVCVYMPARRPFVRTRVMCVRGNVYIYTDTLIYIGCTRY